MGDFGEDTAIDGGEGTYHGELRSDWEIWGPQGGYVASLALRAAGLHSEFPRPATFYCQYLKVAKFGDVRIECETLRRTRRAEAIRARLVQEDSQIMEALIWTTEQLDGVHHDSAKTPEVPRPDEVKSWEEWFPEQDAPFTFWSNIEGRPIGFDPDSMEPGKPYELRWYRFRPTPRFEDSFLDAGRHLTLIDVSMYPALSGLYPGGFNIPYVAPSMDVAVTFHRSTDSEWLLLEAEAPISSGGLVGGNARVWSSDGKLVASGLQQMIQKA